MKEYAQQGYIACSRVLFNKNSRVYSIITVLFHHKKLVSKQLVANIYDVREDSYKHCTRNFHYNYHYTFFTVFADPAINFLPTAVDPVNVIVLT